MEEGDLLLCTVEKIEGTSVFVRLPNGEQSTITTSEIAPGRIRNLRDYVVPRKKIVCKILRMVKDHIDLSLRRVTSKEKKEVMKKFNQEQTAKSAIHSILKKEAGAVEEKILKNFESLDDFFKHAKDKEDLIEEYIPKEFQEQIKKITQKKQRGVELKEILRLKCLEEDGLKKIKNILKTNQAKITYLSAGRFQITVKEEDYKKANQQMDKIKENIKKSAKQNSCEFNVEEK